jgi:Zn-dependent peptidase ImmA (M78 family)
MRFEYRPFASRSLEATAVKATSDFGRYSTSHPWALDIERMLDQQNYQIVFVKSLPDDIEAFCAKSKHIFVRESALDHEPRFRFTLAEEQAHILIHHPQLFENGFDSVRDAKLTAGEYRRFESDAKYLAGALLMDALRFRQRFYHHSDSVHPRTGGSPEARQRQILRRCADDFGVAKTCAARRAHQLQLIKQEVLNSILA